jgi:tetratricopeptide (TPR) repeat protein
MSGFRAGATVAAAWCIAVALAVGCADRPERTREGIAELHDQGRFAESIPLLEGMLDESPGDRELNRLLGLALLSVGQPVPAIWPLERAAEGPDAALEDVVLLGRAHLMGGSPADARAVADLLIEREPDLLEARRLRIEADLAENRNEEALAHIDYILDRQPDNEQALADRAYVLLLLERTEDAEQAIEAAREVLAAADSTTPWTARFCVLDATFEFEKGEEGHVERSTALWQRCLETHPSDPHVVSSAVEFFEAQGDPDTALQALRRAVQEAPENVDFHIGLALRLAARGEDEAAVRELMAATEQPGGLRAWGAVVEYHSARRQWPEALSAMEQYLEALPRVSDRELAHHADLLIRAGDFDAAEAAIGKVSAPELVSLLEGRLLVDRGKPRQAIERLTEAIRVWPDNSVARQLTAEAWEQLGEPEKAFSEYIEAARVDPGNWEAMERLAIYSEARGQVQPLAQLVQRHLMTHPDDPRAQRLLIETAIWSGLPALARGAFAKLGDVPGHEEWVVARRAMLVARVDADAATRIVDQSDLDLADPASAEVLAVYVEQLARLGRSDDALARTRAALASNAAFAPFHEIHAVALEAAGRPSDEIERALARAIEIEPRRASSLVALADRMAASGRSEEALALYDRASDAAPGDPDPAWSAIELLASRGDAVYEDRLEWLFAGHPYHAGAAALLAERIVARDGNLDRALSLAQASVSFGGGAAALSTLGWVVLERGNTQAAIRHLRRSLEVDANSPSTQYRLGSALAREGDAEGARAALEAALGGGAFPEEAEARAELARLSS